MRVFIGLLVWMWGCGVGSAWALDIANYATLKAQGVVVISKTPDKVVVATSKHFSESTGAALPSTVEGVSVADLNKQKAALQAQIDQINQVLTDIAALP